MKLPSTINKTAYFAVTTFSNIKAQHDFLTQYGYAENEIPNLIRAASDYSKLQKHDTKLNSLPRKPKQITIPHTTKNEHNV
jgi:hypothetical protein